MSDELNIVEELERKVLEQLAYVVHSYKTKRMSTSVAQARLRGIWDTASGLVGHDVMDLLSQSINECGAPVDKMTLVLHNGKGVVHVFETIYGDNKFTVHTIATGKEATKRTSTPVDIADPQPSVTMRQNLVNVIKSLKDKGYSILN